MPYVSGLSLRNLSERYYIVYASRESVRNQLHRFSKIFPVEKRFRNDVTLDETVIEVHRFRVHVGLM